MNKKTQSSTLLFALFIACYSECTYEINKCIVSSSSTSSTMKTCVQWSSGNHMKSTTYIESTDCTRNMNYVNPWNGITGPVSATMYGNHECCNIVPTPSPTPFPTYDYNAAKDDDIVDLILSNDFFESVTCQNEDILWSTLAIMSQYPDFMDSIMMETQKETTYSNLRDYTYTLPIFYSKEDDCEVDYFLKNTIQALLGVSVISNANPETLLDSIYQNIKPYIDTFAVVLTSEQKKTSMSVNYEIEFCLDIGIDFCTKTGFGFAWNFNDEIVYYKLGSQALTLSMLDDVDVLPGSVAYEISYDFLGDISYAPGTWYSIDIGFSPGFIAKLASNYVKYIEFMESGYGFSYLAGVDTLSFGDIGTTKCIGLSFGKSLDSVTGGIIPNVSFGMSRGVVKTIDDLSPPSAVDENDPTTWCIAEQLYSVSCLSRCIRPDIEW